MTYLDKWFDFNRRQVELEAILEQTIAEQSEQSLTLKEFYLLHFLNQAQEKSLRQIDLPDKLHLSPSAVSRMVARLETKNCALLSRRCCDQDKRASFICLTSEGQTTLAYLQKAVEESLETKADWLF
ncbi:MarR family winged helix-turn-helix transcriptional regulator [Streptococcus sp. oral taxon 061]|uniref:MarR family winged helix-turn-helix transcriptional regulator n=1 Tax=unclassified Streptococcus TaxID=2608887 RepID=UPI0015B95167|nr:MarR family transcriptional regulator [Streptococcus sp. oral taxon 061]MCP9015604.1 MarR family transcriptional regulator [Streptococcus sp. CF8_St5-17]QLF54970.1 MarR family transcriptional regulator [Streptococcus sp. oral taxon 061]